MPGLESWFIRIIKMTTHIKTIEQAQALPEIESEFFTYRQKLDENHDTVNIPVVRKICISYTDDDDILFFTDKDGRSMKVVYTEDGPTKIRWRL